MKEGRVDWVIGAEWGTGAALIESASLRGVFNHCNDRREAGDIRNVSTLFSNFNQLIPTYMSANTLSAPERHISKVVLHQLKHIQDFEGSTSLTDYESRSINCLNFG